MMKQYSPRRIFIIIISVIILGFALQLFISGILNIIDIYFPNLLSSYKQMVENSFSLENGALRIITVALLAPIGEELVFRGIALHVARRIFKWKHSCVFAVLLTSLLFGIYHGNVVQFCYGFAIGIILAVLTICYSSLIPSIILHIAINSSSYILSMFYISQAKVIPLTLVSLLLSAALIAILYLLSGSTRYFDK